MKSGADPGGAQGASAPPQKDRDTLIEQSI